MILISILATATLFACVQSTPVSYPMFRRREFQAIERPDLLLLLSQLHALENEPFDSSSGRSASLTRAKRVGSLSVSLPLDTLRERLILELARREQQQRRLQVDENRRYLEGIGKRSGMDHPGDSESERADDFSDHGYHVATTMLQGPHGLGQRKSQSTEDRGTESSQDWFDGEIQDDQTRRMANELHLL